MSPARVAHARLPVRASADRRSTGSSVETRSGRVGVDDDGLVVDVGDRDAAEIVDGPVIGEHAVVPVSAFVTDAGIPVAVIHAAIVADMRSPIARIPGIDVVLPAPVAWRPEQSDRGRANRGAGNPIIAVRAIRPEAGRPDVARRGNRGLFVNRQFRWNQCDREGLCVRGGRQRRAASIAKRQIAKRNRFMASSPRRRM